MCFFEQSSGKYWMWEIENLPSGGKIDYRITAFSNATTPVADRINGSFAPNPIYLRLQETGTAMVFWSSTDGVIWTQQWSEPNTSWFTVGPSHVGPCIDNESGANQTDYDFFRRTQ